MYSVAALAQAPAPSSLVTADAPKVERERKVKFKHHGADGNDDCDRDKTGKSNNNDRNVSAFTNAATLTGADKGAAVSAVARGGRRVTILCAVPGVANMTYAAVAPRAATRSAGPPVAGTAPDTNKFDFDRAGRALVQSGRSWFWRFTAAVAAGRL